MAGIARKVGSKDSRFCVFVCTPFYVLARVLFPLSSSLDRQNERKREGFSRSLSLLADLARGEEKEPWVSPRRPFSSREEWDSDAILDNGKLENLVRLALKRLNVSYLTILSRLVWFQQETLVCHEHGRERDICFLEFWAIKFYYSITALLNICLLFINYISSTNKKYLIFIKSFLTRLLQFDYILLSRQWVYFKIWILIIKILYTILHVLHNICHFKYE